MAQNTKSKESAYETQRRIIEKLMENPDKIIDLPDTTMSLDDDYEPPEIVHNVMGSSAGAGSGEFHVYRHLRRKEMSRLKDLKEQAAIEEEDEKFRLQMETDKKKSEEFRLKRKAKREKKRAKLKRKREKKKKQA